MIKHYECDRRRHFNTYVYVPYMISLIDCQPYFYSLLAQSHNTPLLPPKILHDHCLQVLLGHEDVLREIKNNAYANFWGVKEVYYGICASSELLKSTFFINDRSFTDRYIKVHANEEVPCINYDLLICCVTSTVSVD